MKTSIQYLHLYTCLI